MIQQFQPWFVARLFFLLKVGRDFFGKQIVALKSRMYCYTQTSMNTFPVHIQQKGTGSCKSQGDVRQWWPTNTQWLGACDSMIIMLSLLLALCLVLWALQGLVCSFLTFVSLISRVKAAAGSRRCTEGTKDVWIKRWRNSSSCIQMFWYNPP